ncbi:MAG: NLP/P60 protein [Candidatus Peregrinibacteria bacterium Greene1014_49]|nr:MAG: NLP/P60 protein [Candidatus Peregrinibacteria bacterium Greene1014_49]
MKNKIPLRVRAVIALVAIIAPTNVVGIDPTAPYEQEFILTAYYSPLPGQCCYVRGGYEADKILNGEGHTAADGTAVYPGMLAAPPSYAFGTDVVLPGLGTLTVHDRGGAIQVLHSHAHRLDVWVGHGEEGLARALAFGVQHIRGTVYPLGSRQPQNDFDLARLPAPFQRLTPFGVESENLLALTPKAGDRNLSAAILQDHLRSAGYFDRASSGYFGPDTEEALKRFVSDFVLHESTDRLTEHTAAFLLAASRRSDAILPIDGIVDMESNENAVSQAQRILRFLGYYEGRTDGLYSLTLHDAILRFQQEKGLVGTAIDPGAGRIGPLTKRAMQTEWNRRLVAVRADKYMTVHAVEKLMQERGESLDMFLTEGHTGPYVRLLQHLLTERGYFPENKINGNFGSLTREAVFDYQVAQGIVATETDDGAGSVGPETLQSLRREERTKAYRIVRAEGWKAL